MPGGIADENKAQPAQQTSQISCQACAGVKELMEALPDDHDEAAPVGRNHDEAVCICLPRMRPRAVWKKEW